MSFLDCFRDLLNKTCEVFVFGNTKNADGEVTETWTSEQSGVLFGFWTNTSAQTNVNDKYVDDKVGDMIFDPAQLTFTFSTKHKVVYNSVDYFVIGVDDIAEQGEVLKITYRKNYA